MLGYFAVYLVDHIVSFAVAKRSRFSSVQLSRPSSLALFLGHHVYTLMTIVAAAVYGLGYYYSIGPHDNVYAKVQLRADFKLLCDLTRCAHCSCPMSSALCCLL